MTVARRDLSFALLLSFASFALSLAALPPSFAFWDTGELQTVAAILGIAHPPACPAFVLLGWLFAHGLPFGDPAWRVNAMSAAAIATAVGVLYATARSLGTSALVAVLCAAGFATASVTLKDATRAEIQTLELALRVAAIAFALRYHARGRRRDLFAAAFALGLAGATHGIALLLVPSLALLVLARARGLRPVDLALVAGGIALGLLPYAYLPLRSAYVAAHGLDPTVGLGLPPGLPFWNYDDPHTWPNFVRVVTGADFDVHSGFAGFLDLRAYDAYALALDRNVAAAYGVPGAIVAAIGLVVLVVRRPVPGIALALAALLPVPYTQSYNELQDPSRYYLLSLWCAAIAIGAAFAYLSELFGFARGPGRFALALGLAASFAAATPDRFAIFGQRDDYSAPRYVADVLGSTPSDAIVVAEWAYATPLAYAAYVQHRIGDRVVVSASPQQFARFYPAWLRTRPVYVVSFDDDLRLPGFAVQRVITGYYYEYRLAPAPAAAGR